MKKRISLVLVLLFLPFIFLTACDNVFSSKAAQLKDEAENIINWYKVYNELESGADLGELSVLAKDYNGNEVISSDNLAVLTAAKYFNISADYEKFYFALETEFKKIYPGKSDIENAYAPTVCRVILFLKQIGKDPKNFCGYNLYDLIIFQNATIKTSASIYTVPFILEATGNISAPSDAKAAQSDLIKIMSDSQDNNGGWGYEDFYTGQYMTDSDTTAMILSSLALYPEAEEYCLKAAAALYRFKNEDGTYKNSYNDKSSSSTALALKAQSVFKSGIFRKEQAAESDILQILKTFKNKDGGYRAGTEAAPSDAFSSIDVLSFLMSAYNAYKSF